MTDWASTPAAEVDSIVTAVADPLLQRARFVVAGRRRWIRACPPIRHLIELTAMKGVALVPRWGLSLDFVPHLKGTGLAWHRTDKSALFDLVYDPVDFEPAWDSIWSIDTLHGSVGVRRDAERVLPKAVETAVAWLDGAWDLSGALARADWLRTASRPGNRFGFENVIQQPLAYAFLLARTGDIATGRRVLDQWISSHGHEVLRDRLMALLAA